MYFLRFFLIFHLLHSLAWADDLSPANAAVFYINGETRLRFEHLDGQFRIGQNGSDQALMMRTLLKAGLKYERWSVNTEIIDARSIAGIDDDDTNLNNGTNNPSDILQFYLGLHSADLGCKGCKGHLSLGRFTLDVGSRRFVARNRYRNTINAFSGLQFNWENSSSENPGIHSWQIFYSHPVQRKFDGEAQENNPDLDEAINGTDFWGLVLGHRSQRLNSLWYLLGLDEEDRPGYATRDRKLYTLVSDLSSTKTAQHNWRVELAYQWGESSVDRSLNQARDVSATFIHGEWFYRFQNTHMLGLLFDYASGDRAINDDEDQRFDTLYGARRFDFGPTGLYGPFARGNLVSPGLRWQSPKYKWGEVLGTWRAFRLAEKQDTWTSTGFAAREAGAPSAIGRQTEFRWRWQNANKTLLLEAGAAYLEAESVMEAAGKGDSQYAYSQVTLSF